MKRILKFLLKLFLYLFALSVLAVLVFKWVPVPATPLMAIRYFEHPDENFHHKWVSIDEISPNLQLAVIASEDQNFLQHSGFDFKAIEKAIEHNKKGKRVRGASTISQQTAKNVFLWPSRTWVRKGLETYFTFMIELLWSKKRILEVYLNSVELGKSVYGAEAASQFWFHKSASKLTAYEAAALASVLPNPRRYRANPASNYIQRRKNWIITQMQHLGKFSLE